MKRIIKMVIPRVAQAKIILPIGFVIRIFAVSYHQLFLRKQAFLLQRHGLPILVHIYTKSFQMYNTWIIPLSWVKFGIRYYRSVRKTGCVVIIWLTSILLLTMEYSITIVIIISNYLDVDMQSNYENSYRKRFKDNHQSR